MLDKNIILGLLIFMVLILICYVSWVAYVTYWYLISTKVERDFETMIECTFDDGSVGHVPGYCFKPTKFNEFIFRQYQRKFGA